MTVYSEVVGSAPDGRMKREQIICWFKSFIPVWVWSFSCFVSDFSSIWSELDGKAEYLTETELNANQKSSDAEWRCSPLQMPDHERIDWFMLI